jgi:hypothetical protein
MLLLSKAAGSFPLPVCCAVLTLHVVIRVTKQDQSRVDQSSVDGVQCGSGSNRLLSSLSPGQREGSYCYLP